VHTFEIGAFDLLDIDQLPLAPESDLRDLIIEGVNPEIDLFCWISVEFELQRADRDVPIRVYDSIHSEAEDIFRGLERGRDFELSKERLSLL
jgi:hypothetical protein